MIQNRSTSDEGGAGLLAFYRTRDAARANVIDNMERFYSPRRQHSTLGHLRPVACEERMRLAYFSVHRTRGSSFARKLGHTESFARAGTLEARMVAERVRHSAIQLTG